VRRALLALVITLGMLVLTPSPSWACSCAFAPSDTPQHVQHAVTVAAGTVDWTATDGETRTYKVDFDNVYKGAVATSEKLVTAAQGTACGLGGLATGKRYLFFIEGKHPGAMRVERCGGTTAYDVAVAAQVESVTGPPGKPLRTPGSAGAGTESSAHGTRNLVIGLGAGVLVFVVARSMTRRRRPDRPVGEPR
jgi:hypothetical protein